MSPSRPLGLRVFGSRTVFLLAATASMAASGCSSKHDDSALAPSAGGGGGASGTHAPDADAPKADATTGPTANDADSSDDYSPDDGPSAPGVNVISVDTTAELLAALAAAAPGDEITLEDGTYALDANVWLDHPATAAARIWVRARNPLGAKLELCSSDGFQLWNAPYWIFEDLLVEGVCHADSDTANAHAFHVMYRSSNVMLRRNKVVNFKSHVKLNAGRTDEDSPWEWPDDAWFIANTWQDTEPIGGAVAHNALNIDGGDRHVIRGNAFVDLVRLGDGSASSIYVKMTARDFLVEQNLVACTRHVTAAGDRRGIYSGDELGPSQYCDGDCANQGGLYRNNIVLGCKGVGNSTGIVIGYEREAVYAHNTLFDVKSNFMHDYDGTTASIVSNVLYAPFVFQNGAQPVALAGNLVQGASGSAALWKDPAAADFTLLDGTPIRKQVTRRSDVPHDFCGHAREALTDIGAIEYGHSKASDCVQRVEQWYQAL